MFKLQKGGGTGEALLGDSKKMFSTQGCFWSGLLPRTTTERQTGSIFIGGEREKANREQRGHEMKGLSKNPCYSTGEERRKRDTRMLSRGEGGKERN